MQIEAGGGEQGFGVGRLRGVEDAAGQAHFDYFSGFEDDDAVRQRADHREVVADEQIGDAVTGLQGAQQVEDFRLDRDVQGAGGFVKDEDFGLQDEGAGDGDALALAAAEFMRVAGSGVGRQADLGKRGGDAGHAGGAG